MSNMKLTVVDSLSGMQDQAAGASINQVPGFQVDRDFAKQVGLLGLLTTLEDAVQQAWGIPIVVNAFAQRAREGNIPPHVDGGFAGFALHENSSNYGKVYLAHYLDVDGNKADAVLYPQMMTPSGLRVPARGFGPIYDGDLEPGTLTVFSQGNVGGMLPSLHWFNRDGYARFRRFATTQRALGMTSKERVAAKENMLLSAKLR